MVLVAVGLLAVGAAGLAADVSLAAGPAVVVLAAVEILAGTGCCCGTSCCGGGVAWCIRGGSLM